MRIGYLASGAGSLIRTCAQAVQAEVFPNLKNACLVSDRPCGALQVAEKLKMPCLSLDFADKAAAFKEMASFLEEHNVSMLLLTFNRLLPTFLLKKYPNRILNVHGSLLPSFTGFGAIPAALKHGVTFLGSTIHLVDDSMDGGPIVVQGVVPVQTGEGEEAVREKLYKVQQQMVLHAVDMVSQQRLRVEGRKVLAEHCHYGSLPVNPVSLSPRLHEYLIKLGLQREG